MYKIKALLVHNYYTEDIFPSIGILDDEVDYLKGSSNELILKGYIKTDKDIDNLDLELKLYFSYIDDFGNRKDIYYKTTTKKNMYNFNPNEILTELILYDRYVMIKKKISFIKK